MRRDIVEQFPGDICGESLGMPPTPLGPTHTHAHTHFSLHPPSAATAVVRALRWEIKKKLLLSPCRRDGRLFLSLSFSFFFLCLTRFMLTQGEVKRGEERGEKTNNVEERKKAILRAVAFHHTTNNSPSPPAPAPSTATLVEREWEKRGGPGPCDMESMRAQLHPQAEWTGACCVSPAWLIWLRGRRTATALPALTPYSPGLHEPTHTHKLTHQL